VSLIIKKPGILTLIQDMGRFGSRRLGINPGGPMDTAAAQIVNILLGNDENAPLLEMHFPAAEIELDEDHVIAIGGADFAAEIDGEPVPNWSTALARKGSVLRFRKKISGNRAYLAVSGGIAANRWLDSASTNLAAKVGGFEGRRVGKGDAIGASRSKSRPQTRVGVSILPRYSRFPTVRILAGNEFDHLTAPSERTFLSDGFTLTNDCDRMGFRLRGKPLDLLDSFEMVSSAVAFGTIQLLPDGQIILLMADHQTSGGYPRIGNVISVDLPLLAQCGPGDGVSFELISTAEAERLAMLFEKELNFLRVGCRLQTR